MIESFLVFVLPLAVLIWLQGIAGALLRGSSVSFDDWCARGIKRE